MTERKVSPERVQWPENRRQIGHDTFFNLNTGTLEGHENKTVKLHSKQFFVLQILTRDPDAILTHEKLLEEIGTTNAKSFVRRLNLRLKKASLNNSQPALQHPRVIWITEGIILYNPVRDQAIADIALLS